MEIAARVKKLVKKKYGDGRVYVFGSVVEGRAMAASDIGILIVCNQIDYEE